MSFAEHFLSAVIAAIGAWINSVAGGGTFLTFPLLTFMGCTALQANIISTIALWPGSVASSFAYHRVWRTMLHALPLLISVSLLGSFLGAWLLLHLPEKIFEFMVPWLLLFAALLLTFGPRLKAQFASTADAPLSISEWKHISPRTHRHIAFTQFLIAVYGGYFGAGIGILMLAALQFAPFRNMHEMNAVKVVLGTAINVIAFVMFVFSGKVDWNIARWMLMGGILGGYVGTYISLFIPAPILKKLVLCIAWLMTITYFIVFFG